MYARVKKDAVSVQWKLTSPDRINVLFTYYRNNIPNLKKKDVSIFMFISKNCH